MKTFGQLSPAARLAMAFSFLFSGGNLRASGPGVAGNAGSTNGAVTTASMGTGAVVSGGSRGGGVAPSNAGRSSGAPAVTSARLGVSFANSAPQISAGGYMRSPVGRANVPATYSPGLRATAPVVTGSQPTYRTPSRPTNTWSGTAVAQTDNAANHNQFYRSNGYTNNRPAGQHLNPGAFGANLTPNRPSNDGNHRGRSLFPHRYYNYPYAYGPYYAPYLGYSGGYYGAYPYYADGANLNVANGFDSGTPTVTPQYTDQGKDASEDPQNPTPQPAPQNQAAPPNAQSTVPNNGPDSLVEAVQEELIRRGYFGGRVDAMYGPDTKEALRKFQQDHHLADSGLINEATLHALQLD